MWLLLRMTDVDTCNGTICNPTAVRFALYGDGRVVYRSADRPKGQQLRIAALSEPAVISILADAERVLAEEPGCADFRDIKLEFTIRTSALIKELYACPRTGSPLDAFAGRLMAFDSEVGGESIAPMVCHSTALETIARDDAVAWNLPIWQNAGANVWVQPVAAFAPLAQPQRYVGFPSYPNELKALWWVGDPDTHAPLSVDIARIPDGMGSALQTGLVLNGDPRVLLERHDRPSGVPGLPPGCYQFNAEIGGRMGIVVEQVNL